MVSGERGLVERLAQYETLVEQTAPPLSNPAVCTCDRCTYGRRYIRREVKDAAA